MTAKTALVVLGMHRSGTSSVAGALVLAGAAPPKRLMAAADDNPKGFWESSAVADLNDRMLAQAGSNWHDWRAVQAQSIFADPAWLADTGALVREEFGDAPTIVLKDPRICRLFPIWRRALVDAGYDLLVISPFRAPSEVAASLVSRNAMSRSHALRLWMRHVLDGEHASRGLARRFVMWPDFLTDWRADFAELARLSAAPLDLGDAASTQIEAFLSSDLRRQSDATAIPGPIARAHALLVQLARHGEHPDIHRSLDELRAAFNQACAVFDDAPR